MTQPQSLSSAAARQARNRPTRRPSDSRQKMIDATARLVQRQGYAATGVNQIIEESGAPKGSLYFHFPDGKEQLAAEAVHSSGRLVAAILQKMFAREASAAAAVDRFVSAMADRLVATEFVEGCSIATIALEAAPFSDRIATETAAAFGSWRDLFAERLASEGRPPEEARQLAVTALCLLEGALLLAKAQRSREPLDTVRPVMADLLQPPA